MVCGCTADAGTPALREPAATTELDGAAIRSLGGACPAGAIDLGASSQPGRFSLLGAGEVELGATADFLGARVRRSGPIEICVPDDVVSLVLMAPGAYFTSFVTPEDGELIDGSSAQAYVQSPARPSDVPTLLHPVSAEHPATGGVHRFELGVWAEHAPQLFIGIRRGHVAAQEAPQASVRVNLVFVEDGLTQVDLDAVDDAFDVFAGVFATAGLHVEKDGLGMGVIEDRSLAIVDDLDAGYDRLVRAPVSQPRSEHPMIESAVNVYLVRELSTEHGPLLGYASGIPGFVGFEGEGVLVATSGHRHDDGSIHVADLANTLAHEIGHFLGLSHTTEADGSNHDPIADTSECTLADDADSDHALSLHECEQADASNLMFWLGVGTSLTEEQGAILRSNPLARPIVPQS